MYEFRTLELRNLEINAKKIIGSHRLAISEFLRQWHSRRKQLLQQFVHARPELHGLFTHPKPFGQLNGLEHRTVLQPPIMSSENQ